MTDVTGVTEPAVIDPGNEADLTQHRSAVNTLETSEVLFYAQANGDILRMDGGQVSPESFWASLPEATRLALAKAAPRVAPQSDRRRQAPSIITCPHCQLLLGVNRARPYVDCPGCLGTISLFYDRPVAVVAPQKWDADLNWRRVR